MTCLICPACGYEIAPPPEEFLVVGNLAMNTAYSMAYADRLIRLPRKQALLLAALMRDPGRPLPSTHLMDASDIWGAPDALKVYISRLRALIGHVAEIRTHLGMGYSIHPGTRIQPRNEEPMAPAPPMTPAEIRRAVELYAEHPSSARVARLIGRSKDAVRRALRQAGVDLSRSTAERDNRQPGNSETLAEVDEAMRIARQDWLEGHRRRKVLRAQL